MAVTAASVERVAVANNTSAVLANANRNRRGLHIYNDSGQILYVKLGEAAASTDFTEKLAVGGRISFRGSAIYTGIVTGRLAAGGPSHVQVTESYG